MRIREKKKLPSREQHQAELTVKVGKVQSILAIMIEALPEGRDRDKLQKYLDSLVN